MNLIKKGLIVAIAILVTMPLQAQTIDAQKSKANFSVSNMRWMTVEGNFSGMKGNINFNEADPASSSFNVCLDAATVNTENKKRDDHLRNADFFHVDKYPEICYASTSITKTGKGYETNGNLTMHGVTKSVKIPFTYSNGKFTGKLKISRYDYEVGKDTGTFMVGEDIKIEIIAVTN